MRRAGQNTSSDTATNPAKRRFLALSCLAIESGLLLAGLWPFNFWPRNKVQWLGERNGIRFAWQGVVHTAEPLETCHSQLSLPERSSVSLEVWAQPWEQGSRYYGEILTLLNSNRPQTFALGQIRSELVLHGRFRREDGSAEFRARYEPDVFHEHERRFLTITSGPEGLAVYTEGKLRRAFARTSEDLDDFCGRLVLGHSITGYHPWAGNLFGVAIYLKRLTPSEVLDHYHAWQGGRARDLANEPELVALYRFNEGTGQVVHDASRFHAGLLIPARFRLLRRTFLHLPQMNSWRDPGSLRDIAINVLGFVPFGSFVFAYVRSASRLSWRGAALVTLFLGGATSFVIEILQAYLPSRDSSVDDLITNSLGTLLGVALYRLASLLYLWWKPTSVPSGS